METVAAEAPPPLNQEQQEAAEGFMEFLLTDEREMRLDGPGGTGKTFTMGNMIDKIMPRYFDICKIMGLEPQYTTVQMTATTNKAAEVLGDATNRPTGTIQSFLNLTVQEDFKTGRSKLSKSRNWMVHENKIIFVDEGSMIDTPLDSMIAEGTCNCKIVYVGDECQMAPVMEPISPIYKRKMRSYKLTQPMRTSIPELHALNWQARTTVETGEFKPIEIIPGIIDWLDADQMEMEVAKVFAQQTADAKLLAYTNKTVQALNGFVRDLRQLPPEFTPGEVLVNNTAIRLRGYMLSVEEEVTIIDVKPLVESKWIDNHDGEDIYMDCWNLTIDTRHGGTFTDVLIPVDRKFFDDMLRWYKSRKAWSSYYGLKNHYPDLRQRDASTVYKAQGSSIPTVYIDASNLSTCNNPAQVARMLYVAVSRARLRVVFYGYLADKYGGFLFK